MWVKIRKFEKKIGMPLTYGKGEDCFVASQIPSYEKSSICPD
ncbi:MAG: hypothetical protein WCI63_01925 [bacterium]